MKLLIVVALFLGILAFLLDLKELFILATGFIFSALYVIHEMVGKIKESLERIETVLEEIHQNQR